MICPPRTITKPEYPITSTYFSETITTHLDDMLTNIASANEPVPPWLANIGTQYPSLLAQQIKLEIQEEVGWYKTAHESFKRWMKENPY